jgi:hypothetical protein
MITSGRARTRTYRITGVSPRRHAATDDFADALAPHPTRQPILIKTNQHEEQCVDGSEHARISISITQSLRQHRCRHVPTASNADLFGWSGGPGHFSPGLPQIPA